MEMKSRLAILVLAASLVALSILFLNALQHTLNSSFLETVITYSTQAIERLGYPGIFLLMTLESALFPIPSEVVMPFAGFLAWSGKLDLLLVIVSGTLGNIFGSYLLYELGRGPGLRILQKYGRYLLVEESEIMRAQELFSRYGSSIILAGRMLPAVRTVISLPAGIARMDLGKFLLFTALGSIPWNAALTYMGWLLAENWVIIERYARILDYIVVISIVFLIAAYYLYRSKPQLP